MKKILILRQATGNHGRGATDVYIELFHQAFPEAEILEFAWKLEWNNLHSPEYSIRLTQSLQELTKDCIVIALGAEWHSRILHLNPHIRESLSLCPATKIATLQESYLAKNKKSELSLLMHRCFESSAGIFDILIFNHYRDFEQACQQLEEGKSPLFLYIPFLNPVENQDSIIPRASSGRVNRILFVGDAPDYPGNPYKARANVLAEASESNHFDWIKPSEGNQHVDHKDYIAKMAEYRFVLVPPSIDSSLTVRQIEACAAGAIPITIPPQSEQEMRLFADGVNCLYYRLFGGVLESFDRARQLDDATLKEIQANAIKTARSHAPSNISKELRKAVEVLDAGAKAPRILTGFKELLDADVSLSIRSKVAIDMVFFQYADTGIARVWQSILEFLVSDPIKDHIVLLIREDSRFLPEVTNGFASITIPRFDDNCPDQNAFLLDHACDQASACVFVSTYMTWTHSIFNVSMIHDCIPERVAKRYLWEPIWEAKRKTLQHSDCILTISDYSAEEISAFYPESRRKLLFVTPNTIRSCFTNIGSSINLPKLFKSRLGELFDISEPFCLLVGEREGYLGYKNGKLALEALTVYNKKMNTSMSAVLVGGWRSDDHPLAVLDVEPYLFESASRIKLKRVSVDDEALVHLYSKAVCLLYLSEDEGCGLPVYECLASGGRVIVLDKPYNKSISHPNLMKSIDDSPSRIASLILKSSKIQKGADSSPAYQFDNKHVSPSISQQKIISELLQIIQSKECSSKELAILKNSIVYNSSRSWKDICGFILQNHPSRWAYDPGTEADLHDVAFVTSTYKSADFFAGLMQDINQFKKVSEGSCDSDSGVTCEHIVIDSASPTNEMEIAKAYLTADHPSFMYYKTPYRESLYAAWNRGVRLSRSKYISNANTDDRHSPVFAACAKAFLDSNATVALAYPDQIISTSANTPYSDEKSNRRWAWPAYSYSQILTGNHVGSTPIWRRSVHSKIGYFNDYFQCAGDWDFWLRIATQVGSLGLINLPLSSYLFNPLGIEHGNPIQSLRECQSIQSRYGTFGEYKVSPEDCVNQDKPRELDSMQYSGVVCERLSIVVVESLSPVIFNDILGLGEFPRDSMPLVIVGKGSNIDFLPVSKGVDCFLCKHRDDSLVSVDLFIHRECSLDVMLNSDDYMGVLERLIVHVLSSGYDCTDDGKFMHFPNISWRDSGLVY